MCMHLSTSIYLYYFSSFITDVPDSRSLIEGSIVPLRILQNSYFMLLFVHFMVYDKMKNIPPSATGTIFTNPYGKTSSQLNIVPTYPGDIVSRAILVVRSSTSTN